MKKLYLLLLFIPLCVKGQEVASERKDSHTYIDLGLGVGSSHGILGLKTVLGYEGNGLLLGFGQLEGFTTSSIGVQGRVGIVFVNIGYGTYGFYTHQFGSQVEEGMLSSMFFITGVQANLVREKFYFEIGLGFRGGDSHTGPFGNRIEDPSSITGDIGLSYRIGW